MKNAFLFALTIATGFCGGSLNAQAEAICQEIDQQQEDDAQQELEKYLACNPELSDEDRESIGRRLAAVSTPEYKAKEKFEREVLSPLYEQLREFDNSRKDTRVLDEIIREKNNEERGAIVSTLSNARKEHMKLADAATSTPAYKAWYRY